MTNTRWFLAGAAMFAVAAMLVALAITSPRTTSAQAAPCGTPTPQLGQINAFQQLPTCTPVRKVSTATPTFTVTVEPSSTPAPPTQEPTKAPPTATPTGAAGGQAITPPNTGSGPDSGAGYNLYMLLAAGLVAAMGAGSIAVAARRHRS